MAASRSRDPYRLLGVSHDATRDEVTQAYVRRTTQSGAQVVEKKRRDLDTAYRLLWRPRTRARYDRLRRASARRMRWTSGLGVASVLLLLGLGLSSGFWLASQDSHGGSLRSTIPFLRPAPSPNAQATATRGPPPSPATLTLAAADLPLGYHLLSQGPASFSTASAASPQSRAAPPSWDVVYVKDSPQSAGRRLVESLVVIYPEASAARQALAQVEAAEAAQSATQQPPPAGLGSYAGEWIEHAPNGGPYAVVRVAWVSGNVIAQLSVLDLADQTIVQQADVLALAQERHLASYAP